MRTYCPHDLETPELVQEYVIITAKNMYVKRHGHWFKSKSDIFSIDDLNTPFLFVQNIPYPAKCEKQYDCVLFYHELNKQDLNKYCANVVTLNNVTRDSQYVKPYLKDSYLSEGRVNIRATWRTRHLFTASTRYVIKNKNGFSETRVASVDQLLGKVPDRKKLLNASYN